MTVRILNGDCRTVLATLPSASVHCIVTSPPYYGLRDYGTDGQIGLEQTPDAYVAEMVAVFRETRRVLRDDGTLFLNLGDSYMSSGTRHTGRNDINRETPGGRGGSFRDGIRRAIASDTDGKEPENHKSSSDLAYSLLTTKALRPKDLIGIPWRVAFALQADGWYLRQDIIWSKPNPMPESVTDRCTKAHEYVFMLSKSPRYWYDAEAISEESITNDLRPGKAGAYMTGRVYGVGREGRYSQTARGRLNQYTDGTSRNRRSVWTIAPQPHGEAHFATMPPDLADLCIKAGCPSGGTVLDPFGGAGTTGLVADRLGRNAILIELNPDYATMARHRIEGDGGMFSSVLEAAE